MTADPPRSILLAFTGLDIGGGIASVGRCMARVLREDLSAGNVDRLDRVLLLDRDDGRTADCGKGIVVRCGGSQRRFLLELWRAILRTRPDLVLFDHLGPARALLPHLPLPRPRYGVFVHGGELVAVADAKRLAVLSRASILLANSRHTADAIRALPSLVNSSPIVVPLCIEPPRLECWSSLRATGPAPARKHAALIVGRMVAEEPGKGHQALIESWPQVREHVPDAELWIVGDGDDRSRLEDLANRLDRAVGIRFFGAVSDELLSELYRTASVFAMPSRQEGFGLVYLEAMWHGLPCIGSTADAASCVIDDSCGRLVPYGDAAATAGAIVELLSDPAKRDRLAQAGARRASEEFTFGRFSQAFRRGIGMKS